MSYYCRIRNNNQLRIVCDYINPKYEYNLFVDDDDCWWYCRDNGSIFMRMDDPFFYERKIIWSYDYLDDKRTIPKEFMLEGYCKEMSTSYTLRYSVMEYSKKPIIQTKSKYQICKEKIESRNKLNREIREILERGR